MLHFRTIKDDHSGRPHVLREIMVIIHVISFTVFIAKATTL
jgi:hypothetical protein